MSMVPPVPTAGGEELLGINVIVALGNTGIAMKMNEVKYLIIIYL